MEKAIYKDANYQEPEGEIKKTITASKTMAANFLRKNASPIKKILVTVIFLAFLIIALVILAVLSNRKAPAQPPPADIIIASPTTQPQTNTELQTIQNNLDIYSQSVDSLSKTTVKNFAPPKVDLDVIF